MTAEIMRIEDLDNCDTIIERASEIVKSGGIIVYPTDTSYGIGCDPRIPDALDRLKDVKRRDRRIGVPLLFNNLNQCEEYHEFGDLEKVITRLFWPGMLSLVVEAKPEVPDHITVGRSTIIVRVPNHVIPRSIAQKIGGPIVGTSANRTGGPSPYDVAVALDQLGDEVDLYIDGGPSLSIADSTIIGVEGTGTDEPLNIKVYREGQLSINELSESLKVDTEALGAWTTRFVYRDM
ncbi:MAG: threonylcarbamoyl-AMP synthase [Candidatus Thorarchaeota archaeon]|nr:MAG: threonylcarbamoyl-AMP synthase [Candidatus Thorarchaeota archaeon]